MICRICKEKKAYFANGLCKNCYHREYRKNNRDKIKKYHEEYNAEYYKKNRDIILEKRREYTIEKRANGLCVVHSCNNPIAWEHNNWYCTDHRDKLIERRSKLRKFRKRKGLCMWCGKPLDGTSTCYCNVCHDKRSRYRK